VQLCAVGHIGLADGRAGYRYVVRDLRGRHEHDQPADQADHKVAGPHDSAQRVDKSQRPDFAGYRPIAPLYERCNLQTVLDGLSPAKLPARCHRTAARVRSFRRRAVRMAQTTAPWSLLNDRNRSHISFITDSGPVPDCPVAERPLSAPVCRTKGALSCTLSSYLMSRTAGQTVTGVAGQRP
jgi:hypothetical protein